MPWMRAVPACANIRRLQFEICWPAEITFFPIRKRDLIAENERSPLPGLYHAPRAFGKSPVHALGRNIA
jgi:hypothetical protein